MEKTITEWFDDLPEPYRTQAINNMMNHNPDRTTRKCDTLGSAINQAFTWIDTPEGQEYWQKLSNLTDK